MSFFFYLYTIQYNTTQYIIYRRSALRAEARAYRGRKNAERGPGRILTGVFWIFGARRDNLSSGGRKREKTGNFRGWGGGWKRILYNLQDLACYRRNRGVICRMMHVIKKTARS